MKMRRIEFQVEGRGEFPFDMLRYNACWPKDPEDAAKIQPNYVELRTVTLCKFTDRDPPDYGVLTPERWRSFLWSIVPESFREIG